MSTKTILKSSFVGIVSLFVFLPTLAQADTFVCTAGDVGCVIASIAKSNANGPTHDYLFLRAGTYMLTRPDNEPVQHEGANGLPVITGALTIVGAGQGVTLLARAPTAPRFRLFDMAPTAGVTLAYLTLQGGEVDIRFFQRGGCIRSQGSFMLYHSTVRECTAWIGGAIDNRGQQTILHSTIIENYADFVGGALTAGGPTLIDSSWIGNNVAEGEAGIAFGGPLTIRRSVIDGNIANMVNGGGIGGVGTVDITSSLVSENVSRLRGGGIELDGTLTLSNSTLWANEAEIDGGGLYVAGGEATLRGVAVLFNRAGIPELGIGHGGGIATTTQGTAHLEKSWLLWNQASKGAQCTGNVTLDKWNVIGNPTRFHTGPPCE